MLLRAVEAERFLSVGARVRLDMPAGLTVVTGPNGVGKTNLGRAWISGVLLSGGRGVILRPSGWPCMRARGMTAPPRSGWRWT
jgi:ABC-type transport system involved in cytochrome c biogenesis ATPase subunit